MNNVCENIALHNTGGINIDTSRVPYLGEWDKTQTVGKGETHLSNKGCGVNFPHHKENWGRWSVNNNGRFPSNIILSDKTDNVLDKQSDGGVSRFFKVVREK